MDHLVYPDRVKGALSSLQAHLPGTIEVTSCAEAPGWVLDDPEVHSVMPEPRLVAHRSVLSTSVLSKMTLMKCLKLGQEHPSPNVSSAGCSLNACRIRALLAMKHTYNHPESLTASYYK